MGSELSIYECKICQQLLDLFDQSEKQNQLIISNSRQNQKIFDLYKKTQQGDRYANQRQEKYSQQKYKDRQGHGSQSNMKEENKSLIQKERYYNYLDLMQKINQSETNLLTGQETCKQTQSQIIEQQPFQMKRTNSFQYEEIYDQFNPERNKTQKKQQIILLNKDNILSFQNKKYNKMIKTCQQLPTSYNSLNSSKNVKVYYSKKQKEGHINQLSQGNSDQKLVNLRNINVLESKK